MKSLRNIALSCLKVACGNRPRYVFLWFIMGVTSFCWAYHGPRKFSDLCMATYLDFMGYEKSKWAVNSP